MALYYAEIVLPSVTAADGNVYDKVTFYKLSLGAALHKGKLEKQIQEELQKLSPNKPQASPEELRTQAHERKTARLERINPLIEESAQINGPVCDYFLPPGTVKKGYVLEQIPDTAIRLDQLPETNTEGLIDLT